MTHRWLSLLVLAAACGGGRAASPGPSENAPTADAAVRSFLQAVADSNINRMGRFWGTSKGPATVVRQPADYEQRLVITQSYLRKSPYRVVRIDPVSGTEDRMTVLVEFDRQDPGGGASCVRTVPIEALRTGKFGWIVTSLDLNRVGSPARPCSGPRSS